MSVYISNRGPRALVISFSANAPAAHRATCMAFISDFLTPHEYPQGGRFAYHMADPVDPDHPAGATLIIDTLQDANEPPLFLDLHRALRQAAASAGIAVASPDPDAPPEEGP